MPYQLPPIRRPVAAPLPPRFLPSLLGSPLPFLPRRNSRRPAAATRRSFFGTGFPSRRFPPPRLLPGSATFNGFFICNSDNSWIAIDSSETYMRLFPTPSMRPIHFRSTGGMSETTGVPSVEGRNRTRPSRVRALGGADGPRRNRHHEITCLHDQRYVFQCCHELDGRSELNLGPTMALPVGEDPGSRSWRYFRVLVFHPLLPQSLRAPNPQPVIHPPSIRISATARASQPLANVSLIV